MLVKLWNVQNNIQSVVEEMGNGQFPVIELLKANHTLMQWLQAHQILGMILQSTKEVTELVEDLSAFWGLCSQYGIELNTEQKIEILQDLLND